jgi:hypothetical protein
LNLNIAINAIIVENGLQHCNPLEMIWGVAHSRASTMSNTSLAQGEYSSYGQQYYALKLEEAIALHKTRDITTKGLLKVFILTRCKPGWQVRLTHQSAFKTLRIKKSAFYEALAKLKEEGFINYEAPEGLIITRLHIPQNDSFRKLGKESGSVDAQSGSVDAQSGNVDPQSGSVDAQSGSVDAQSGSVDAQSGSVDSQSGSVDSQSGSVESESPKPSPSKDSSAPTNCLLTAYQLFINSLSKAQRESFLKFGREKAAKLPNPPQLPDTWIKANWEELWQLFQKTSDGETAAAIAQDWENDPRRDEWLEQMRVGRGWFVGQATHGSAEWHERRQFAKWAQTNNLVWPNGFPKVDLSFGEET